LPEAPQAFARIENEAALLRTAAAVGLVKSEQAMRVGEGGSHLLFLPSRVERVAPEVEEREDVLFYFGGALDNVFAALVVRLARSGLFRLHSAWRRRAVFDGPAGEPCALTLREPSPGDGVFALAFQPQAGEETRLRFDEYVHHQLRTLAHNASVRRERLFHCPSCGQMQGADAIRRLREKGRTDTPCVYCGTGVPLLDRAETADDSHHAVVADMNRAADVRRRLDVAALTLRGKTLANDYDVYLCGNLADKEFLDKLGALLKEQGILSWSDTADPGPGIRFKWVLDAMKARAYKAVVFIAGASDFSVLQSDALRAALELANETSVRIATALVGKPGGVPLVPEQLSKSQTIDMRGEFTPAAMEQLIEFITGQKGGYIDPNAARFNYPPTPPPGAAEEPQEEKERHARAGVLRFNLNRFFSEFTSSAKKLKQSQFAGLDQLLGFIEQDSNVDDVRAAALILALVQHETADTWQPLADSAAARKIAKVYAPDTSIGKSLGNKQASDGFRFRPRGYIRITGRSNYERMGGALGIDLVANPDAAQEPATAYRIMSEALYRGMLTGKKLKNFISGERADYDKLLTTFGPQKIADRKVAVGARMFEKILRSSLSAPNDAPREETPPAAPKSSRAPAKKSARPSSPKSSKKSSRKASSSTTRSRSSSPRASRSKKSSRKSSRKSPEGRARPYKK
jgi:hypothetical protein